MPDISEFFKISAATAPFVILAVLGLVTWFGKLGVTGKWQLVTAMVLGLIFGGGLLVAIMGLPIAFSGWFAIILYGTLLGLFASGIYDTGKKITGQAIERALGMILKGKG